MATCFNLCIIALKIESRWFSLWNETMAVFTIDFTIKSCWKVLLGFERISAGFVCMLFLGRYLYTWQVYFMSGNIVTQKCFTSYSFNQAAYDDKSRPRTMSYLDIKSFFRLHLVWLFKCFLLRCRAWFCLCSWPTFVWGDCFDEMKRYVVWNVC